MLKKLQQLSKEQPLVANSAVQRLDYGFWIDENFSFSRYFLERPEERPSGRYYVLRPIERNKKVAESGEQPASEFIDSETGDEVASETTYNVQFRAALEAFDGVWLPAPFFKRKGFDHLRRQTFEPGPSNWARLRVVKLEGPDEAGYTYRLTLAFDTHPEEMVKGGAYVAPAPEDVRNETRFEFAPALRDNSWLLEQNWMQGWLKALLEQAVRERSVRIPRHQDGPAECAHWAFYVVLLQGLETLISDATGGKTSNAALPIVRFLNTLSATAVNPTDVDLVLDIGNSRTCGVLIERGFSGGLNIKDATVLELRDISRPQFAYQEPFRSHVEFVQPWFGNPYWGLASGRDAFNWPSLVRVGPEALRLNVKSNGSAGDTGLSSPKRYLWDERENRQLWYFNAAESGGSHPVMGVLMQLLTQEGNVLKLAGPDAAPALQPKFSRASLFTFMVMELLLQAIVQMNSPGYRAARQHPNVPRRLHRVVFTIPTATPIVERTCYEKRCVAAVKLLWEAFGWGKPGTGTTGEPEINIAFDEATCTQIVYLYNEIVEKFRKAPKELFKLLGKGGASAAGSKLRVASLDIGGGTTDLMIVTYQVEPTGDALNPQQNFREGFRRAGDDILEAIISEHVLKPLARSLQQAGMAEPEQFLTAFMSDAGKDAMALQMRKLFVTRVLAPIALALLSQYETVGMFAEKRDPITFAEIAGSEIASLQHIISFFEQAARKEGAKTFSMGQTSFEFDFTGLGATTAGVLGPILSLMCEVINRFDCDVLLMSGRPSRLPIIRDLILRFLPAPPHRIVFMHEYRVGNWYKFSGRQGTIEDPKTTVVMGALLCALAAERRVTDFALNATRFGTIVSTANYIGRIFGDDLIGNQDVIFQREKGRLSIESRPLAVDGPMFIGFRQLPVERWPATYLFFLDIPESRQSAVDYAQSMPWMVTFRRREPGDDNVDGRYASSDSEMFWVDRIVDRNNQDLGHGSVQLRLQTLRNVDGYWLDTGIVAVNPS